MGPSFRSNHGSAKQPVVALASWHRQLPSPRGILPACLAVGHCGWPRASPSLRRTMGLHCLRQAGGKEPDLGTLWAPGTGAGSSSALAAHLGVALPPPPVTAVHQHRCRDCQRPRKISLPLENTSSNSRERQRGSNNKNLACVGMPGQEPQWTCGTGESGKKSPSAVPRGSRHQWDEAATDCGTAPEEQRGTADQWHTSTQTGQDNWLQPGAWWEPWRAWAARPWLGEHLPRSSQGKEV